MNVDRCIICGKSSADLGDVNPLTEEHIIPKAPGNNSLKCCFLCKTCNSRLGDTIDAAFINSFDIKLIRNQLGIKGRNGIPNPFAKGKDSNGNDIYVDIKMQPKMVSHVEKTSNGVRIHASSIEEAKKIAKTIMVRHGMNKDTIDEQLRLIETIEKKQYKPEISYDIAFDPQNRFLAILKIAYEYACFKLGDNYFNDTRANEIREILFNEIDHCIVDEKNKKFGVCFAPEELRQLLGAFHKICEAHHLMIIQNDAFNRLIAIVSLFGRFEYTYVVLLSNDASDSFS
ncbi:MAG: HNH endonuclease [Clostridia bacterium]|nr:HNH endonuclease [Clostridia bacterium]